MLAPELSADCNIWLSKLSTYLKRESYSRDGRERTAMVRRFLMNLEKNGLTVHTVRPSDVTNYLSSLRRLRRSPRRSRLSEGQRNSHRSALYMLLRMVRGTWPPPRPPRTKRERFHRKLLEGYDAWGVIPK